MQMKNKDMSVSEAENYLNQIPRFSKDKHSVDTVRQMLHIMGNPEGSTKFIHVAGTNGKGSVCAFLSSILLKAGYTTAVFTSPHLVSTKERFSFNGQDVDDALFLESFYTIRDYSETFEREGLGHPSYFEYLFLMFMVMLKERPCEFAVLETGLGGRLDATNALEHPALTVITSISLDHMEYLGSTVTQIAGEKAGIIKPGIPVVYDNTALEASAVIEQRAKELKCSAYPVDSTSYKALSLQDGRLSLTGFSIESEAALSLDIPFAAEYQAVNAMLAVRTAEILGIKKDMIKTGIRTAYWPGRMEQIKQDVYLDGAHNEGGIREFSRAASELVLKRGGGRKLLLFAVVSDKEYQDMAEILCREFGPDVLVLTQIDYSRGLDIGELDRAAHEAWEQVDAKVPHDIRVIPTVEAAFNEVLKEKKQEDTVFCAGSLYLIGEIKRLLRRNEDE